MFFVTGYSTERSEFVSPDMEIRLRRRFESIPMMMARHVQQYSPSSTEGSRVLVT